MKNKSTKPRHSDVLALRKHLGLSQHTFWRALGTTQSGGSRYENVRRIPTPVAMLLDLVYVKGVDLEQVKAGDMAILRFLKETHPDLYASLGKAAGVKCAPPKKTRSTASKATHGSI